MTAYEDISKTLTPHHWLSPSKVHKKIYDELGRDYSLYIIFTNLDLLVRQNYAQWRFIKLTEEQATRRKSPQREYKQTFEGLQHKIELERRVSNLSGDMLPEEA